MTPGLSHADTHHLSAAHGWLELGNPAEAAAELAQIAPAAEQHPSVLDLRWQLCAHLRAWEAAAKVAERLTEADPGRAESWIHLSFALHELKRTQEAYDRLRPAAVRFPNIWTIPYNLACYCAQLGRLDDAQLWLNAARKLDPQAVAASAKEDPDLQPLRERLSRPPN